MPFDPANVGRADGPGLAGNTGLGTWIESSVDLSRFRGRKIRLRWLATTLKVVESTRVNPGVVYTTFHHAESKANAVTSDLSDWATNCPEYKVTAVEVTKVKASERQRPELSAARSAEHELATEEA